MLDICQVWMSQSFRVFKVRSYAHVVTSVMSGVFASTCFLIVVVCGIPCFGFQFVPLILITILINDIKGFFAEASEAKCSDSVTDGTVRSIDVAQCL